MAAAAHAAAPAPCPLARMAASARPPGGRLCLQDRGVAYGTLARPGTGGKSPSVWRGGGGVPLALNPAAAAAGDAVLGGSGGEEDAAVGRRRQLLLLAAASTALGGAGAPKAARGVSVAAEAGAGAEAGVEVGVRAGVFVAGATGRTGRLVVGELVKRKIPVRAGVRSLDRARKAGLLDLPEGQVEVVLFDVAAPPEELADAVSGAAAVICTVGFVPTFVAADDRQLAREIDNEGTCRLVDAAAAAGARRFVLLSSLLVGAEPGGAGAGNYRALNLLGGVLDEKRVAEDYLRASALDWVVVRAGVLASRPQGGVIVGSEGAFVGDANGDRVPESLAARLGAGAVGGGGDGARFLGTDGTRKCQAPFLSASGNVCGVTRLQAAQVCVEAACARGTVPGGGGGGRVVEVVARPEIPVEDRAWKRALLRV